jgi:pilus assembly protein CpaB
MRTKSILLLVVALGCGVVASVAVSQVVLDQKNRAITQTVPILVVAKEISAATKIPPDSFRIEQWPVDRVPLGAIADPKLVENKFTKQRIYPGEPIIEAKLSLKGRDFIVPEGYRTFDIGVTDVSGGSGYIGPGDHVDVFGYFDKGPRVKAAKSVKVMENLEVVMIDGVAVVDPDATKQKKSSTIQLLVKDSQYIVLDTASNLGKLRLALRPPTQVNSAGSETDNGEKFTEWLRGESESSKSENANIEKPNVESVVLEPAPSAEKPEKHEMVIVTPNKSTMYRFSEGKSLPQKIDMDQAAPIENPAIGDEQGQNNPKFPPNYKSAGQKNPMTALDSSPAQGLDPVNPANSVQPNLTWDPASGNWQSGGFKATYPSTK